ncbi:hypothetical protein [Massilia sp. CF038]|uniref:hypothetical protein n=1 Tax=Massilia sp. CF038 TaxID=1881045 RepID=UPI000923C403|nr:hypothetical protein [Massilia sp. CF038]SHG65476.1 hypothetical protein SAMN05428948_1468 [Massilia sp. CF038]
MKIEASAKNTRLDRELEREREQRHRNDEARAGIVPDDDLRLKDARQRSGADALHRYGSR